MSIINNNNTLHETEYFISKIIKLEEELRLCNNNLKTYEHNEEKVIYLSKCINQSKICKISKSHSSFISKFGHFY
jgi:hypothetical protein